MPNTISAQEMTLGDVLSDEYLFKVPDYQRPYAWEWEHAQELLDDINDAAAGANNLDQVEFLDPYFLGCIVIVKSEKPDSEIVDGQQRLTTLTMLCCALRDAIRDSDPTHKGEGSFASSLNEMVMQRGDAGKGLNAVERLTLRKLDEGFFRKRVQQRDALSSCESKLEPKGETQERILQNAKGLYEQVQQIPQHRREILTRYLNTKCYLVVVATADTSSAVRIFSVLHTRGLELSPTDIIKAQIASPHAPRNINRWEELEDGLGRDDFRLLFSHVYTVRKQERNRKSLEDVFVRDVLSADMDGERFIAEVLERNADTFEYLLTADLRAAPDEARYLRSLRQVDNTDWIPPALMFVDQCGTAPVLLVPFLRDLERLAYWMFLTRTYRDPRVNRYIEILKSIDSGGDLFASSSPLQLTDDEKRATIDTLSGQVNMKWAKAVLLRIDGMYYEQGVAEYQRKIITVEHVLPQNPDENSRWLTLFPDAEQRALWTWKLANLVLLSRSKNSSAGNLDFDEKKRTYFMSGSSAPFLGLQPVMDEEEWTPDVLQRRQRELIGMLAKEWRLQ